MHAHLGHQLLQVGTLVGMANHPLVMLGVIQYCWGTCAEGGICMQP
jgi:hypothetical protein